MSEEIKNAIAEMAQAADGNEKAQFLLKGLKLGLEASGVIESKEREAARESA